jgi:arsenate reductase-like glutaredoxin family protein
MEVQIFGLKSSKETRAAERFFKERRIKTHNVDLHDRPMSAGEINRFIQKFGLNAILDISGKAYIDAGLEFLRVSDDGMLSKIEAEPKLLRLPLVRFGKYVTIGLAETDWKAWITEDQNAEKSKAKK